MRITLIRSTIGYSERQKRIIESLGLRRMHQTVEHDASPTIQGMLNKVGHYGQGGGTESGTAPTYRATTGTQRFQARLAKRQADREALLAELGFFDENGDAGTSEE
ncbi:MAG: 50S ribosomal protein L30 [Thermomicrobiales bacterium]